METKAERLVFIDVLRVIAAVQMIQGHAIAATLAPAYRQGALYEAWTFARGLTSVMFLFAAGYSFALARPSRTRAWKLIALGYLMHAPFAILLGAPPEATLQSALAVDVLQCIGVSLLSLSLLPSRVAPLLALAVFVLAPLVSNVDVAPARPVLNYVSSAGGSQFPLFPWLGYVLAGYALGARRALAPALLASACAVALLALQPWARLCFVKLACVMAMSAWLAWWFRGRTLPPWLARLSRETLFLYVSHVVILYADQVGLAAHWGGQKSPWFGVALALALLVACSAGAVFWRSLRRPLASGTRATLN